MVDTRYQAACERFLIALGNDGGVESILAEGYAALGYPMHVLDPAFALIAKIGGEGLADPRWAEYDSEEATISEARLATLKESGFLSQVQGSGEPTIDTSVPGDVDVVACDIGARGSIVGRLGVWASKPYGSTELAIVSALSKALYAEIRKVDVTALGKERYGTFFLDRLLHEPQRDGAEIERLRKRYSLELPPPYRVLVLADRREAGAEGRAPHYLIRKVAELLPEALCTIVGGDVVLLTAGKESAIQALGPVVERNALVCGVSRSFIDLPDAGEGHRQAKAAVRYGEAADRFVEYERFAHLDLLASCTRALPALGVDFPPVRRLADYDRAYRTEYLRTLATYIDLSCNMAETARAIGVHYNTVKYRMDVIADIMGLRISGMATILKTSLALLLRE